MGRIEAKRNSDQPCKSASQDDCPWADQDGPASFPSDCDCRGGSQCRTHKASQQRQDQGFDQELPSDTAATAISRMPRIRTAAPRAIRTSAGFSILKSLGASPRMRCRCRSNASISRSNSGMAVASDTLIEMKSNASRVVPRRAAGGGLFGVGSVIFTVLGGLRKEGLDPVVRSQDDVVKGTLPI